MRSVASTLVTLLLCPVLLLLLHTSSSAVSLSLSPPSWSLSPFASPPTLPLTVGYAEGHLYLIADINGSSPILQQRNASTLVVSQQLHLDPSYHVIRIFLSARSLWCDAWTIKDTSRVYTQWALQVDIATFSVVHRVQLGTGLNFLLHALYGVDRADTTLLTPGVGGVGNEVRLLNATTGQVLGNYTGGVKFLIAWDAVLHPITRAIIVEDWQQSAFLVISPLNNSVVLSIPFPPSLLPYSVCIDSTGTFLYSLWRNGTVSPYPNTFIQHDLTVGKVAQMSVLRNGTSWPVSNWAISPRAAAGDVWFIRDFQSNAQLALLHNGQSTVVPISGPVNSHPFHRAKNIPAVSAE